MVEEDRVRLNVRDKVRLLFLRVVPKPVADHFRRLARVHLLVLGDPGGKDRARLEDRRILDAPPEAALIWLKRP